MDVARSTFSAALNPQLSTFLDRFTRLKTGLTGEITEITEDLSGSGIRFEKTRQLSLSAYKRVKNRRDSRAARLQRLQLCENSSSARTCRNNPHDDGRSSGSTQKSAAHPKSATAAQRNPAEIEAATRLQVFLDHANFSPGAVNGHYDEFTLKALALYRHSRGEQPPPPPAKPDTARILRARPRQR